MPGEWNETSGCGADSRLDLTDIRDDGNDPLRQIIAQACAFIELARQQGGSVLVHCVRLTLHSILPRPRASLTFSESEFLEAHQSSWPI